MREDEDPVFTNPEGYGIENPEAPGEPDRENLPPVTPVPGTGRSAREEHMRRHEEEENRTPLSDYRDRREREGRDQARHDVEEAEESLTP